jgi:magnesium transporter
MSETVVEAAPPENSLDEDDRLKPEYVSRVVELVAAGEAEAARDLVSHLHPADLADLFELVPAEVRHPLAAAVADLLDGDVLAEMNEWVREELIDAEVNRQALMIAYIDDFWLMAWAAVVVTPLAIFMRAGRASKRAPPVVE